MSYERLEENFQISPGELEQDQRWMSSKNQLCWRYFRRRWCMKLYYWQWNHSGLNWIENSLPKAKFQWFSSKNSIYFFPLSKLARNCFYEAYHWRIFGKTQKFRKKAKIGKAKMNFWIRKSQNSLKLSLNNKKWIDFKMNYKHFRKFSKFFDYTHATVKYVDWTCKKVFEISPWERILKKS